MKGIIELDSERGKELGFTSEHFNDGSYLWDDGDRVMISFVYSTAPGNFRRLVAAIHAEGKSVAVPTPLPNMERIVRKNGYVHSIELTENGDKCDMWMLVPSVNSTAVR